MNPTDTTLTAQIAAYQPWLSIGGVIVLFLLLRFTRKGLRKRVDTIGYRVLRERGLLIWFWLNAPGVMLHELSHAFTVLLFTPFGFRITSISLFRIKPMVQRGPGGRVVKTSGRQSLQLGEVQYVRPQGRFMSYVGDGLSGIAPLFGGVLMLTFLYWVGTGYNVWDGPYNMCQHLHTTCLQIQIIRPGWPWWTLLFAPYLILTVTSELWPSRQDWYGARWFVIGLTLLIILLLVGIWYYHYTAPLLQTSTFIASRIIFVLLILLLLDLAFLIIAEILMRVIRR